MEQQSLFAIDGPQLGLFRGLRSPFAVAGWLIPVRSDAPVTIEIEINGQTRARTNTGLRRPDVEQAYPDTKGSLWCGFWTEVFADDLYRKTIDVEVRAVSEEITLSQFRAKLRGLAGVVSARERNWQLAEILACPECLGSVTEAETFFQCEHCQRKYQNRRGTPVFNSGSDEIISHLLQTTPTNPNGEDHTRIIESHKLVLDVGAGNPRESEHYPNVVFHEFVQYAHTDVVSVCARLPYRDNVFDAVISKAAFEHLARPWEMADEIYRVLKPGGLVHVDTAFMYPLHGDPYHFFNMTLDGAKEIFKRFQLLRCGVKPYQTPSYGLRAQMEFMLEHVRSPEWRERITAWRDAIGAELDSALDAKGIERLAAGVFFEGTKPLAG